MTSEETFLFPYLISQSEKTVKGNFKIFLTVKKTFLHRTVNLISHKRKSQIGAEKELCGDLFLSFL